MPTYNEAKLKNLLAAHLPGTILVAPWQCRSIKVKRLFLYMAGKAGHDWRKRLDISALDLGKGDRSVTKGGTYIAQFGITIPEELATT
jgi:hypothetical protein